MDDKDPLDFLLEDKFFLRFLLFLAFLMLMTGIGCMLGAYEAHEAKMRVIQCVMMK